MPGCFKLAKRAEYCVTLYCSGQKIHCRLKHFIPADCSSLVIACMLFIEKLSCLTRFLSWFERRLPGLDGRLDCGLTGLRASLALPPRAATPPQPLPAPSGPSPRPFAPQGRRGLHMCDALLIAVQKVSS